MNVCNPWAFISWSKTPANENADASHYQMTITSVAVMRPTYPRVASISLTARWPQSLTSAFVDLWANRLNHHQNDAYWWASPNRHDRFFFASYQYLALTLFCELRLFHPNMAHKSKRFHSVADCHSERFPRSSMRTPTPFLLSMRQRRQ